MCLILNGYRERADWVYRLTPLGFCWYSRMTSEIYETKVDTPEELLARIVGVAACMNKLRPTTSDLQTRVANCTEVDGGIVGRLLGTATVLLLKYQIKI